MGIADGGALVAAPSLSLSVPIMSAAANIAVMSSDFFLRPAHARLSRLPALDVVLGAGDSGGGLGAAGRAWLWPMVVEVFEREVAAAPALRPRGKKRGLEEDVWEETERSDVKISLWLEMEGGAAGRRSEDALEEESEDVKELEEREADILLGRAWVSVVRGCDEGVTGILVDAGRE